MNVVFHLSAGPNWTLNPEPMSLSTEGFVHLSDLHQVLRTANRWFEGEATICLFVLDSDRLGEALRWEDLYQHGEEFPHLYAPIPADALVAIATMERGLDGLFDWPPALSGLRSLLLGPRTQEEALIEPTKRFPEAKLPERCVLCFFSEALEKLTEEPGCQKLVGLGSEIGAKVVYVLDHQGESVAVCHPGVGGPVAAATLEELIALGCRQFLLCGGAGSLVSELTLGHLVVADRAWRDEGLSHHYLPAEPTIAVDPDWVTRLSRELEARQVKFTVGASWTTDALYRETPSLIAQRKAAGCLTVEMELASLLTVAQYRNCRLAALLYCGDDLGTHKWDFRNWTSAFTDRERLLHLALDLVTL